MSRYRIEVETIREDDGRWGAAWRYEVSPCRGGPCGTSTYFATEVEALACALGMIAADTVFVPKGAQDG